MKTTLEQFKVKFNEKYKNNELQILNEHQFIDAHYHKMDFYCSKCGNIWTTKPYNTLIYNCIYCKKKAKKTTEMFKKEVEELTNGEYELVSEYIATDQYVLINHLKCDSEPYKVLPKNFISRGNRCPSCSAKNRMVKVKNECFDRFKEKLEEKGYYINDNEYVNFKTKIKIYHQECGNFMIRTPQVFSRVGGSVCPLCKNEEVSNSELEIRKFINELLPNSNIICNERSLIQGKELDIYIKDKNIAFEFNGLYWHSETKLNDRYYHLNKTIECGKQGVQLVHILEDEWLEKREIVKSKISYLLNANDNTPRIYARDCYVTEIYDKEVKNNFLTKNHIEGKDKSSISLGLYTKKDNKLVSVMTFCDLEEKTKYDGELSRFASDINYIVVGAYSKIWAYFCKEYEWNRIVTHVDKRWSRGNLYFANKWQYLSDTDPNYWYCKNVKRYHKNNFKKHLLKRKFPNIYNEFLSESDIMNKAGYFKLWDCGTMVFEITKH